VRIAVAAIGRLKSGPDRDLCDRYLDRARKVGGGLGFKGFDVAEFPESRPVLQELLRTEQSRRIRQSVAEALAAPP